MNKMKIKNLNLWYGEKHALKDTSLEIPEHKIPGIALGRITVRIIYHLVEPIPNAASRYEEGTDSKATWVFLIIIGIGAAIYLNEYAKNKKFVAAVSFTTEVLSGIPSIIFGLFGMIFFGEMLGLGYSFK